MSRKKKETHLKKKNIGRTDAKESPCIRSNHFKTAGPRKIILIQYYF